MASWFLLALQKWVLDLAMVSAARDSSLPLASPCHGSIEHLLDQMFNLLIFTCTEGWGGEGAGPSHREPVFSRQCWAVFDFPVCALENQTGDLSRS